MLYNLLCELFHRDPRTDLVKNCINTSTAAPVMQAPQWFPLAKSKEADRAIEEMKNDGIIELDSVSL